MTKKAEKAVKKTAVKKTTTKVSAKKTTVKVHFKPPTQVAKKVRAKAPVKAVKKESNKREFTTLCVTKETAAIFLKKRNARVLETGLKKHIIALQMVKELK